MKATIRNELEHGAERALTRRDADDATTAEFASDTDVQQLQANIDSMNAAAQRIEAEIAKMLAETNGLAANTPEYAHALQAAHDMHSTADAAKAVLSNAATDPKTGRKLISAKSVTTLANSMHTIITGGESEGTKIETATAETRKHELATAEKAKERAAQKTPAAPRVVAAAACTTGTVCAVTTPALVEHPHWVSNGVARMGDISQRITQQVTISWMSVSTSATNAVTHIIGTNPVEHLQQVAGNALQQAAHVVQSVTHSLVGQASSAMETVQEQVANTAATVREQASNAMTMVQEQASSTMAFVRTGVSQTVGAVKVRATNAMAAVSTRWHQGTAMIADAFTAINPWAQKTSPVAETADHRPIIVQQSAMDKAIEQAKAVMKHSLPQISLPELPDFMTLSAAMNQRLANAPLLMN